MQGEETVGGEFESVLSPVLGFLLTSLEEMSAIISGSGVLTWEVLSITRWRLLQALIFFSNKPVFKKIRTEDVF
jgi:hypothetical protein